MAAKSPRRPLQPKSRKPLPPTRRRPAEQLSGWRLRDDVVERALVTGEFARELEELFGPSEYSELRQLAVEAQKRGRRGGRKVLILPGIMGSKLGVSTKLLGIVSANDIYWIDPVDVILGKLARLALDSGSKDIEPLGVILIAYAKLKLRLRADGYDADFYPYDWRRSIAELGRGLARQIGELSVPVSLVAHSMGGLVARAAIRDGAPVERLIQLGSPNFGSFAPLLALRGVDDTVKKIAALDLAHDRTEMINRIFRGFPGLLELLPSLPNDPGAVFFDWSQWPKDSAKTQDSRMLAPRPELLRACSRVQDQLAPVDPARWSLIAGVNQKTVTGAALNRDIDELQYERSLEGDGTVPLRFALLPGMPTYYVEESHGQLANHKEVARAVADILDHGRTDKLPVTPPSARRAAPEVISERKLREIDPFGEAVPAEGEAAQRGRRGPRGVRQHLRASDLRGVLYGYAGPGETPMAARAQAPTVAQTADALSSDAAPWNRLVVGRARQHRLDIQIAQCSITQVSARAYVLGLFREVNPTGAAAYIDSRLDGAVTEFMRRRMFSGGIGEVFILPANRSRLPADMVLFAGLGYFDQFNNEVQQTTAENVLRTFVRTRVEDFATVLFGGGSGSDVGELLAGLLRGFVRGKLDADVDHHFRRVTLCELDRARYEKIRTELYRLAGTPLFENVEVTFTELPPPPAEEVSVAPPSERAPIVSAPDPVYLIVRREREENGQLVFGTSLLTAGTKAAIMTAAQSVSVKDLEAELTKTGSERFGQADGRRLGQYIAEHVIAPPVRQLMTKSKGRHLVVVHDGPSSRIPWETLRLGDWEPALGDGEDLRGGVSRRYMTGNLSVAKYLEQRPQGATLKLLLVVNPTGDLSGARHEGDVVHALFKQRNDIEVTRVNEEQATRKAVLGELASGRYDLLHYAGHAFFDPELPERSGLLCHGDEPLTGTDLGTIGNLPKLVFFNACESGRLRRRGRNPAAPSRKAKEHASMPNADIRRERVAPAEAFLSGGIANFIGTYWPVGDESAEVFSKTFYSGLLAGKSIGTAILESRRAINELGSVDWSDYIHYGDFGFTIR